jgi:transcriptional regulator of aroF, aroG, tyrA and aromatic amino acid transport
MLRWNKFDRTVRRGVVRTLIQEAVIKIHFEDRAGLGLEIFKIFDSYGFDKIAMEVTVACDMMIKFRAHSDTELEHMMSDLRTTQGVLSVEVANQMPFEDREYQLRTILNSVSEGIIAVDKNGIITHINEIACQIFRCAKEEVIGSDAIHLFRSCSHVLSTLATGESLNLIEGKGVSGKRKIKFFVSSVPILNKASQIIGAVFTVRDDKQIREIISTVDKRKKVTTFENIIYQSEIMRNLVERAKIVAKSNSTVLLRGESGTGKELFAESIHMGSPRAWSPFVSVNCAAFPDSLLESELFGYEEGAFTGAMKGGKKGIFEQANHGTLFLDEIGEISPAVQVRLLRVLQEGTIRRVGGTQDISIDVRVIAATHRNLEDMIAKGLYREDLYYRLNVIPLNIPPLRNRSEDILLIAPYLVRKICAKLHKPECHLSTESLRLLMSEDWPGNVRQLENTLERTLNMVSRSAEITPEVISKWADMMKFGPQGVVDKETVNIVIPFDETLPTLKEIVRDVEKQILERTLRKYPSSRQAGNALGVSNTTILNKIHAYGLADPLDGDKFSSR